jgi:hypothetical protein
MKLHLILPSHLRLLRDILLANLNVTSRCRVYPEAYLLLSMRFNRFLRSRDRAAADSIPIQLNLVLKAVHQAGPEGY